MAGGGLGRTDEVDGRRPWSGGRDRGLRRALRALGRQGDDDRSAGLTPGRAFLPQRPPRAGCPGCRRPAGSPAAHPDRGQERCIRAHDNPLPAGGRGGQTGSQVSLTGTRRKGTGPMFDLDAIQKSLREFGFDGWLLYDFRASNVLARRVLDMESRPAGSRRYLYMIPATGQPAKLVHKIEPGALDHLPGEKTVYLTWQELEAGIGALVSG